MTATNTDSTVTNIPENRPRLIHERAIVMLKLNTIRYAIAWRCAAVCGVLGFGAKRRYDSARNIIIEVIPSIERSLGLDNCIIRLLVEEMDLCHIEDEVHVLIYRGPVVASDLRDH